MFRNDFSFMLVVCVFYIFIVFSLVSVFTNKSSERKIVDCSNPSVISNVDEGKDWAAIVRAQFAPDPE